MKRAKQGDRVTICYIGTLDNGYIFDQHDGDDPLTFVIGQGEVFPALEQAITGMAVGEVRNIHLAAEQAYGRRRDDDLLKVPREMFPFGRELRVGRKLSIELGGESVRPMRIRRVDETEVLLDGNHDLAGCDLTFALQLVAID